MDCQSSERTENVATIEIFVPRGNGENGAAIRRQSNSITPRAKMGKTNPITNFFFKKKDANSETESSLPSSNVDDQISLPIPIIDPPNVENPTQKTQITEINEVEVNSLERDPGKRDVLLYCVIDAILGALGLPDSGQIFPDNDPKWKGAASSVFTKEAVRLMHEAGYELGNLDATLILQRPKLSPHKEAIRANLSNLLGADPSVVNLKAKTHEKVDSLGENRSIAAHTVVLLMKK
ncbi:hypothetical protein C3L33_16074, partial [Rhododendron williamsianum]